jgi:hypothetical protein
MEIIEYSGMESIHPKENDQIIRIENIIIEWAKESKLEYIYFFKNVNYFHKSLELKWNRESWNGEIDLLLICEHHFVIFELKNKKGIIKGKTQHSPWQIKYHDSNEYIEERDFFIQCSKMKAFFSLDYYPKKILPKIDMQYKLRPDVLLVFLDGSDTSNVIFSPPVNFTVEEYYRILEKTNEEDKFFMEMNFYYSKIKDKFIINYKNEIVDTERLRKILNLCDYPDRVSKWFHVITEDKIKTLLPNLGSDSFRFDKEIINMMIKDFQLNIKKEYHI